MLAAAGTQVREDLRVVNELLSSPTLQPLSLSADDLGNRNHQSRPDLPVLVLPLAPMPNPMPPRKKSPCWRLGPPLHACWPSLRARRSWLHRSFLHQCFGPSLSCSHEHTCTCKMRHPAHGHMCTHMYTHVHTAQTAMTIVHTCPYAHTRMYSIFTLSFFFIIFFAKP